MLYRYYNNQYMYILYSNIPIFKQKVILFINKQKFIYAAAELKSKVFKMRMYNLFVYNVF